MGGSTVYRAKRRFAEGNLERALSEDPRPGAERKLSGKEERPTRTLRLRVSPQARRQSLRLRRASALARGQGHRAAGGGRLRSMHARICLCPLSGCRAGSYRKTCRPTRPAPSMRHSRPPKPAEFCDAWSSPNMPAGSTSSRSRSGPPRSMSGSQNRRPQTTHQQNCRMGATTKRRSPHQMDVHNRQGPRQNGARLPRHVQRVIVTAPRYFAHLLGDQARDY